MPQLATEQDLFLPTIVQSSGKVLVIADNGSRFTLALEDVPTFCDELMGMAGRIARDDCMRIAGVAA